MLGDVTPHCSALKSNVTHMKNLHLQTHPIIIRDQLHLKHVYVESGMHNCILALYCLGEQREFAVTMQKKLIFVTQNLTSHVPLD